MEDQTKSCPMCGEQILAVAIKCKHCQSMLSEPSGKASGHLNSGTSWAPFLSALMQPIRWVRGVLGFWLGTLPALVVFGGLEPTSAGISLEYQPGAFLVRAFIFAVVSSLIGSLAPAAVFVGLQRKVLTAWLPAVTTTVHAAFLVWWLPDLFGGWSPGHYLESETFLYFVSVGAAVTGTVASVWLGRARTGEKVAAVALSTVAHPVQRVLSPVEERVEAESASTGGAPELGYATAARAPKVATERCPHCNGEICAGATRCLHCWKHIPR